MMIMMKIMIIIMINDDDEGRGGAVTSDDLNEIVGELRRAGRDGQFVEAKKATTDLPKSVRRTLSAFSNSGGGVIVLGLDEEDSFAATGVEDVAAMLAAISDVCSDTLVPPVRAVVESHTREGVDLVTIDVPEVRPSEKPCYVKAAGMTNGSYLRVADADRKLTSYEVQLLVEDRGQPRHDEEPVGGTSIGDLDSDLLGSYLKRTETTRPRLADLELGDRLSTARILTGDGREVSLAGPVGLRAVSPAILPAAQSDIRALRP